MYCWKCGKETEEYARFCSSCGAEQKIQRVEMEGINNKERKEDPEDNKSERLAEKEMVNAEQLEEKESESAIIPDLTQIVVKNLEYYLPEFERINRGEKPRFNWGVFLLMPFALLYRRSWSLFKKNALVPYGLEFVACLLVLLGVRGSLGMLVIGGFLAFASSVLFFVLGIRMGKNYNRLYFEQCLDRYRKKDETAYGVSGKNVVRFLVISILVSAVFSLLVTAVTAVSVLDSMSDTEYDVENYDTISTEETLTNDSEEEVQVTEEAAASKESEPTVEKQAEEKETTVVVEEKGEYRPVAYSNKYPGIKGFTVTKEQASNYFVKNIESLRSFDTLEEYIDYKYGDIIYDFYVYVDYEMNETDIEIYFRDDYGWTYEDWEQIYIDVLTASSMISSAQTYFVYATFEFYNGSSLFFDSSNYYFD